MVRRHEDPVMTVVSGLGRGLLGIGKVLWRLVTGGKSGRQLNKAALFADWQVIESLADSNDTVHLAQAVQQADRFVDHVMRQVGGHGASFADRSRSLQSRFAKPIYQGLWDAHKLRNQLAHQHGSTLTAAEASHALRQFRAAARELGAF